MIEFKSKNLLLLTGAGFTKNFGGFLGSEMWEQILHDKEIQSNKNLRGLLLEDIDFESVYSSIILNRNLSKEDKSTIGRVIERIYQNLDEAITKRSTGSSMPHWGNWGNIVTMFLGKNNEKGFFFTLNQDTLYDKLLKINGYRI